MVDLHHAATQSGAVQLGRLARPYLQAEPRGQGARHARPIRQATQAVWLDPRDGVSLGERDLRRRVAELAGGEAGPEAARAAAPPGWGSLTPPGRQAPKSPPPR